MAKALGFLAILAGIGYAVFYANLQHKLVNAPRGTDTENKYMRQTGDDSSPDTGQAVSSNTTQDSTSGN